MKQKTIFQKIIDKEINADIEYEDKKCIVIHDINPQAPKHLLIIPKTVIPHIKDAKDSDQEILGYLLLIARKIAKRLNMESGYRLVINNGLAAGETVPHLHIHLIGGRVFNWPPG